MAFLGGTFDATQVQPGGSFEVIPAGEYRVMISDSAMETNSKGTGQFLKLTLQIIDGPHQGATLFDRLNLVNPNQKAVEIAQRTLSAICHAVGVMQVQDSAQLHNRPMLARVAYNQGGEPDGQGGVRGPSNEVKGYKPMQQQGQAARPAAPAYQAPAQSAAQPAQAFTPPPAQQQAPQASGVPPWMAGQQAA